MSTAFMTSVTQSTFFVLLAHILYLVIGFLRNAFSRMRFGIIYLLLVFKDNTGRGASLLLNVSRVLPRRSDPLRHIIGCVVGALGELSAVHAGVWQHARLWQADNRPREVFLLAPQCLFGFNHGKEVVGSSCRWPLNHWSYSCNTRRKRNATKTIRIQKPIELRTSSTELFHSELCDPLFHSFRWGSVAFVPISMVRSLAQGNNMASVPRVDVHTRRLTGKHGQKNAIKLKSPCIKCFKCSVPE